MSIIYLQIFNLKYSGAAIWRGIRVIGLNPCNL